MSREKWSQGVPQVSGCSWGQVWQSVSLCQLLQSQYFTYTHSTRGSTRARGEEREEAEIECPLATPSLPSPPRHPCRSEYRRGAPRPLFLQDRCRKREPSPETLTDRLPASMLASMLLKHSLNTCVPRRNIRHSSLFSPCQQPPQRFLSKPLSRHHRIFQHSKSDLHFSRYTSNFPHKYLPLSKSPQSTRSKPSFLSPLSSTKAQPFRAITVFFF